MFSLFKKEPKAETPSKIEPQPAVRSSSKVSDVQQVRPHSKDDVFAFVNRYGLMPPLEPSKNLPPFAYPFLDETGLSADLQDRLRVHKTLINFLEEDGCEIMSRYGEGRDGYMYADSEKLVMAEYVYNHTRDIDHLISDIEYILASPRGCHLDVGQCMKICNVFIIAGRIDDAIEYLDRFEAWFPPDYGVVFAKYREVYNL